MSGSGAPAAPPNSGPPGARVAWKQTLVIVWLSQFLSIMGFAFAFPFTPFYIQELGVTDPPALNFWVSLCSTATPLALALFAPVWGALADRYGRRLMLLRANFAAAVIVALMGVVSNVETLAALRFLQGVFTGTVTAAQTMVTVQAPQDRSGLALGWLSAAVYSGSMVGAAVGGLVAEWLGYRAAFLVGGFILLCSGLLVLFGAREEFVKPAPAPERQRIRERLHLARTSIVLPILGIGVWVAFARQFDSAFLPLLVQDINGSIKGAASWTGGLGAVSGLAGLLAGFTLGRVADAIPPARLAAFSALGAGLLMIPQGLAQGFALLFGARFGTIYFAGGLDPVLQIWLAKVTAAERRGAIFGWAATARSVGWLLAPIGSGVVASLGGVRAIFFVGALLFAAVIPVVGVLAGRSSRCRNGVTAGGDGVFNDRPPCV